MTDDRLITAIGRLERALSRIEANGVSPALPEEACAEGPHPLEERHQRLRARTEAVIGRLDRLLGEAGGETGHQNGNGAAGMS